MKDIKFFFKCRARRLLSNQIMKIQFSIPLIATCFFLIGCETERPLDDVNETFPNRYPHKNTMQKSMVPVPPNHALEEAQDKDNNVFNYSE